MIIPLARLGGSSLGFALFSFLVMLLIPRTVHRHGVVFLSGLGMTINACLF
jgi:hypothetical protein